MDGVTMVRNFYQPTTPVIWSETLAEYYAHEAKQLEEHHRNLRERDQQMVDKANREDPVKTFAQASETVKAFGTLIGSIREANTAKEAKKEKDAQAEGRRILARFPDFAKDVKTELLSSEYDTKRDALFKDASAMKKFYMERAGDNAELKQDLEKMDARVGVILRETLGMQHAISLNDRVKFHEAQLGQGDFAGKGWTKEQLKHYNGLSLEGQDQAFMDWKAKELAKLGLSDDVIDKYVIGEFQRQNETRKGLSNAKATANSKVAQSAKAKQILGTASGHYNPLTFGQSVKDEILTRADGLKDIEGGPTAIQQATESVYKDLEDLNLRGFIPSSALIGIKNFKFDHPAASGENGATIEVAFFGKNKDERWNSFVKANNLGQQRLIATATALDNQFFDETKRLAQSGASQVEINRRIQMMKNRGLISEEKLGTLENTNLDAQSPAGLQAARDTWVPKLQGGLFGIKQEDINNIQNDTVRGEVQTKFNQLQEWLRLNPGGHIGSLESSIAKATETPLPENGLSQGIGKNISNAIDREVNGAWSQMIWAQYDPKGNLVTPNANIANDINTMKTGLWAARGGTTKDGDGLYSFDSKAGDFVNYRKANNIAAKITSNHNINYDPKTTGVKWRNGFNTEVSKDKYKGPDDTIDYKKVVKSGNLLTNDDVAGVFITGNYSDKIYVLADMANTTPQKLWEGSIERILASNADADKEFASLYTLKSSTGPQGRNQRQAHDIILEGLDLVYKKLENKNSYYGGQIRDINFALRGGWGNLTPNLKARTLNILNKEILNDPDVIKYQADKVAKQADIDAQLLEINKKNARIKENIKKNQRLQNTLSPAEYFGTGEGFQGFIEEPEDNEDTN